MSGVCNDCGNVACVCGMDQAGSELSDGLGAVGAALVGATRERPHPGADKVKFRSEPKDMVVSLPVRVWHQVETFQDGTERHSIKHPRHGVFTGETFTEALHNMKQALQP